jgi:hypothetical protein
MATIEATHGSFGLIDKADGTNAHQLQLWFLRIPTGYSFEVRNAYMPGGKLVKSCVLDSGSHTDETEARRLAAESFSRSK